jgi:TPR repeat protein
MWNNCWYDNLKRYSYKASGPRLQPTFRKSYDTEGSMENAMNDKICLLCILLTFMAAGYSPSSAGSAEESVAPWQPQQRPGSALSFTSDFEEGVAAYSKGDYAAAHRIFLKEAQKGNASAQYKLGYMYANGQGVPLDDRESVKWYGMAAEKGLAAAQYNLALMYEEGRGIIQDEQESVRWYRMAAEKGLAAAQYNLGVMYGNGHGVEQNDEEALRWFKLAASQGLAPAQCSLGLMYANGIGVKQDYREAFRLFSLAAAQNNIRAKCGLAMMHASGSGTVKDFLKAKQLAREGYESGEEICNLVWDKYRLGD